MMSDVSIKMALDSKDIVIFPLDYSKLQPTSIDVTLNNKFMKISDKNKLINPKIETIYDEFKLDNYILSPGEFILGSTNEIVQLSNKIAAHIDGKSSLGRLGLTVHATAGYIDPGYKGNITLEMTNHTDKPIILYENMDIAQLTFEMLDIPSETKYGDKILNSKYQDSFGTVGSKYHKNNLVDKNVFSKSK